MAKGIKTGGRTKGTPNKITSEIKESLKEFIASELNELIPKINELQINERFNILVKLLPYVMPKEIEHLNLNKHEVEPLVFRVIDIDGEPYQNAHKTN